MNNPFNNQDAQKRGVVLLRNDPVEINISIKTNFSLTILSSFRFFLKKPGGHLLLRNVFRPSAQYIDRISTNKDK